MSPTGRLARLLAIARLSVGTALLAGSRVAGTLLVTKLTAIHGGPTTMAVLGTFQNLTAVVFALACGGLNNAIVNESAKAADDAQRQLTLARFLRANAATSAATVMALLLLSNWLNATVLGGKAPGYVLPVLAACTVGFALSSTVQFTLVGWGDRRGYLGLNVCAALLTLLLAYPLIAGGGLGGTLLVAPVANSVVVVVALVHMRSRMRGLPWRSATLGWAELRRWSAFPLMALASAVFLPMAQLAVRDFLVAQSPTAAGIWQGVAKLSEAYMMISVNLILLIALPRFSAGLAQGSLTAPAVLRTAAVISGVTTMLTLPVYLAREPLTLAVFSRDFLPMTTLFVGQIIGDILRSAVLTLQSYATARGATVQFIGVEATQTAAFVGLSAIFVSQGPQGVVMAWAMACAITLVVAIVWSVRTLRAVDQRRQ